jgi:hypothetical protein
MAAGIGRMYYVSGEKQAGCHLMEFEAARKKPSSGMRIPEDSTGSPPPNDMDSPRIGT